MSESTTTTASVNPVPQANIPDTFAALVPWWAQATPEQRTAIIADHIRSGLPVEEYVRDAAEYAGAAELLAAADTRMPDAAEQSPAPAADTVPPPFEHAEAARDPGDAQPTASVEEYQAQLARFGKAVHSAAEANYQLASLAADAVGLYLGTAPGKAQRATCIHHLAERLRDADDESLYPPTGKSPEQWGKLCLRRCQERVTALIHTAATARVLFSATAALPVVTPKGPRQRGTKDAPAVAWGTLRELNPLVERAAPADEYHERWQLLPGVADAARQLAKDVQGGLKRADVVAAVAKLLLTVAQAELALAEAELQLKPADAALRTARERCVAAVERWGGKLERTAPKATAAPAPESGKPAAEAVAADPAPSGPAPASAATADAGSPESPAPRVEHQPAQNVPEAQAAPQGETPPLPTRKEADRRAPAVADQMVEATAKDAAALLLDFVTEHDEPEDVLVELLRLWVREGDPSNAMKAAATVFFGAWERRTHTPAPVQVAQAPAGRPAPAVA
jgi:hypothetical protein